MSTVTGESDSTAPAVSAINTSPTTTRERVSTRGAGRPPSWGTAPTGWVFEAPPRRRSGSTAAASRTPAVSEGSRPGGSGVIGTTEAGTRRRLRAHEGGRQRGQGRSSGQRRRCLRQHRGRGRGGVRPDVGGGGRHPWTARHRWPWPGFFSGNVRAHAPHQLQRQHGAPRRRPADRCRPGRTVPRGDHSACGIRHGARGDGQRPGQPRAVRPRRRRGRLRCSGDIPSRYRARPPGVGGAGTPARRPARCGAGPTPTPAPSAWVTCSRPRQRLATSRCARSTAIEPSARSSARRSAKLRRGRALISSSWSRSSERPRTRPDDAERGVER